jgi:hyaluronoglucosaminidase
VTRRVAAAVAAIAVAVPSTAGAADSGLHWRGIVEGAYGRAWTHAERTDVLRWMGGHGLNAYVHAPKDDLYQRTKWRDPYPPGQMAEFEAEIRLARRHDIEWIPNLSPAVPLLPTPAVPDGTPSRDLCFSCPEDLEVVVEKLRPFLDAGTRTVMISFDDVAKTMTHPEDSAAYGGGDGGFGRANGDFLTRLLARLRSEWPGTGVLTVGADYSGTADTEYLQGLRETLDPRVEVMWTGTNVPSEHWTAGDARAYGERIGRVPLVWDNWTNDDTAGNATPLGTARIFLGPYVREPETADAVGGFFLNAANEAYLNLLPLATAGDWMADPAGYRARRSWLAAIRELAPGRGGSARQRRASLRAWSEASWSNKLDREREAPTFVAKSARMLARYDAGGAWGVAMRALRRELRLVEAAPERLPHLPVPGIAEQGAEFLDAADRTASAGDLGAQLLGAERPRLKVRRVGDGPAWRGQALPPDTARAGELRGRLDVAAQASRVDTEFTYGWRTPMAFEIPPYPVPGNVMDAFIDQVSSRDSAWRDQADEAAASVAVTLDGRPIQLGPDGTFRLPRFPCGSRLEARDGAGGLTAVRLRCRAAGAAGRAPRPGSG